MLQDFQDSRIGTYHIKRHLAHGGMADIYLAENTQTGEPVAIKMVESSDENYCERLRREIAALARMRHDHILPALDHGEYGNWCYMVTPYIEHGTLANRLAQGALSPEDAGEILAQLASALQYAHNLGIVHRDIKASNVLMCDDHHIYLADFGLVKKIDSDHSLTESDILIGTPDYLAPELIDEPATIASDIYALGVLLYQMLTGRLPFQGNTPIGTIWKHIQEKPALPSSINPSLPTSLNGVILKALEKDPERRYQTASDFQYAYQHALERMKQPMKVNNLLPTVPIAKPTLHLTWPRKVEPEFSNLRKPLIVAIIALFAFAMVLLGGEINQSHIPADAQNANIVVPIQAMQPTETPRVQPTKTQTPQPANNQNNQPNYAPPKDLSPASPQNNQHHPPTLLKNGKGHH